jgi:hypothetical protein
LQLVLIVVCRLSIHAFKHELQGQQKLFTQQALCRMWPRDDLAQVVCQELGEREVLF